MYNLNLNEPPLWFEKNPQFSEWHVQKLIIHRELLYVIDEKEKKCELVVCSCWKNRGSSYSFWVWVGPAQLRTLMQYTIREEKVKLAATDHVSDSCALFAWLAGKGRQFYARTSFSCQEEGWKIVPIYKRRPAPGWHEGIVVKKYKSQEFQNEEASPE